jgi:hypothetical protein
MWPPKVEPDPRAQRCCSHIPARGAMGYRVYSCTAYAASYSLPYASLFESACDAHAHDAGWAARCGAVCVQHAAPCMKRRLRWALFGVIWCVCVCVCVCVCDGRFHRWPTHSAVDKGVCGVGCKLQVGLLGSIRLFIVNDRFSRSVPCGSVCLGSSYVVGDVVFVRREACVFCHSI